MFFPLKEEFFSTWWAAAEGSQLYSETDPLPTDGDVLRPQLWAVSRGHPIFGKGAETPNFVDIEWTRTMDFSFLMIGKDATKTAFLWQVGMKRQFCWPPASPLDELFVVRWESTLFVLFLLHVCQYMQAQLGVGFIEVWVFLLIWASE